MKTKKDIKCIDYERLPLQEQKEILPLPGKPRKFVTTAMHIPQSVPEPLSAFLTRAGYIEARGIGPGAKVGRIASDPNPLGRAGHAGRVQDEELEPARRTDVLVRRRCHGARVTRAGEGREQGPLAHGVAVRGAADAQKRDFGDGRVGGEGIAAAVFPILLVFGDVESRTGRVAHEIGRDEDLDAVLFWITIVERVGAGDENATVVKEDGFRVVHAGNGGVGHDGETTVEWLAWVVVDGVEVGAFSQTEACYT